MGKIYLNYSDYFWVSQVAAFPTTYFPYQICLIRCSNQQHLLKTYFCLSNSSETGADGWYYKTFADLRPYSTYIINVTCKTDKGDGPVAEITLTTNQYGKTS